MKNDDGIFLFKFADKSGMEQVLERGPWLIRNTPLILNKWTPSLSLKKDEVTKIPVWVKFHKVSIVAYSEDGLSLIATQIGKPLMLDAFTSSMCVEAWGRINFARALIEISSDTDLKKEVIMTIPDEDGISHTKEVINVEYEWQPPRCADCKIFGRSSDRCPKLVRDHVAPTSKGTNGDGFTEVKRKNPKGKKADIQHRSRHIDGIRLDKPKPNFYWQKKGTTRKGADIDSTTKVDATAINKDECGTSSSRSNQVEEQDAGLKASQLNELGESDDEVDEHIFPEGDKFGDKFDIRLKESLLSPFYNAKYASLDRLKSALLRSMSGASHFSKKSGLIDADISNNFGEYLMSIDIGTPPVKVLGIADTGSDLTWAQCEPCENCYEQVGPILVPSNSFTYQPLSVTGRDRSHTAGNLAVDTFWFGPTSFEEGIVFGCGHDNNGTFNKEGSGIIGLGGVPLSLIKQLDYVIEGKFTYCLIPYFNENQTSKMQFGYYANVTGPNVVSTPLVKKDPSIFYYLTLESVLVGQNNVSSNNSFSKKDVQEGNIIIDSGTTLTFIDQELYEELTLDLTEVHGSPTALDPDGFFEYCYKDLNMDTVPTVTFRFIDADVELPQCLTNLSEEV
ncbi:eukaryotic aspartyl protease family protein [Tanacetum coccineum]